MKSIIEQASSVMKAIEKAWISADNPKEFSVKVFEKEERNFFGMTSKPAKIGIFFTDKQHTDQEKLPLKARVEKKELRHEEKAKAHIKQASPCKSQTPQAKPSLEAKNQFIEKPKAATTKDTAHMSPFQKNHTVSSLDKTKTHNQTKRNDTAEIEQNDNRPAAHKPNAHKTEDRSEKREPIAFNTAWNDAMVKTTTEWMNKTLSLMNIGNTAFTYEIIGKNLKLTFAKPLIENPIIEKQLFRSLAHLIMSSLRNQYKQEIKNLKIILTRPE